MNTKKLLAVLSTAALCAAMMASCGNSSSSSKSGSESKAEENTGGDGKAIKVGIINNDPNESGYRTANDKDLKAAFSAENGFEPQFAYGIMTLMVFSVVLLVIKPGLRRSLFRLLLFLVRIWRRPDFLKRILPLPVTWNRLAAAFLVFILGMFYLPYALQGTRYPCELLIYSAFQPLFPLQRKRPRSFWEPASERSPVCHLCWNAD